MSSGPKSIQHTPSITYRLSQELFKTLGWTSPPENAIAVPFVTMKAKFSHDVISPWFVSGKRIVRFYKTGRPLCVARDNGTGNIYYPNGRLAIGVRSIDDGTLIIVKTPGGIGRDGKKRKPQLCGLFDSLGNGVVYDCDKRKRLVYNQKTGMAWLKRDGLPISWKWHGLHVGELLNDQEWNIRSNRKDMSVVAEMKRMESQADTSYSIVSEESEDSDCGNYVDTSRIRGSYPIKPIIFQINSYIGLRIFNQAEIALTFFADGQQTRLNIGTLYNPEDILSVDKVFTTNLNEKVWCLFEMLPVKSDYMKSLRKLIKNEKSTPCWNLS